MGALKPKAVPTTTTTSQTSAPWDPAQPALKTGINAAADLYKKDIGYKPWTGPLQADLTPDTWNAIWNVRGLANGKGGLLGNQAYDFSQGVIANNGITPNLRGAMSGLDNLLANNGVTPGIRDVMGGLDNLLANNGVTPGIRGVMSGFDNLLANNGVTPGIRGVMSGLDALLSNRGVDPRMQPSIDALNGISAQGGIDPRMQSSLMRMDNIAARGGIDPRMQPQLDQMAATARGDNLSAVNPALQSMLDRAGQRAAASIAGNMSASGRYGSAGSQSAITQGMLDAMNPILAQNYENERGRQVQAQGQLADIYNNAQNTALQTNRSLADIYNTGQNSAMQAQGLLSNIFDAGNNRALQAQTAVGNLYDAGANRALQAQNAVGNLYDAGANRALQAQNAVGNLYDASANRALQAQTAVAGLQNDGANRAMQAAANSKTFTDALYDPAARLSAVGGLFDDRASSLLDAQVSQWDQQQSRQWEQIARLMGIAGGAGQMGGTQSGTANGYRQQQSGLMNGLGAVTSLGGLFGKFL